MPAVGQSVRHGTGLEERAFPDLEVPLPVSPLSVRRGKPVRSFYGKFYGRTVWAGAFRDRSSLFQNIRLETILEARLPYFLYTLREGHLYSSWAPFPFPLDLLQSFGPPGELTILSTGSILATLRLAWVDSAGVEQLLRRDPEFSASLLARIERHEAGVNAGSSPGIV